MSIVRDFSLAAATVVLACGCSSTVDATATSTTGTGGVNGGTGGASASSGGAGGDTLIWDGGSSSGEGGGGTVTCAFPVANDAGPSTSAQPWCEPGATNPADCPASAPVPGDPCPISGLQCGYASGAGAFVLHTCNGHWQSVAHTCEQTCKPSDMAVPAPAMPACGSLPEIPCVSNAWGTAQERANMTFHEVAACCNAHAEALLTVWLSDGCATASAGPAYLVECMNALLAGRRIACAPKLSCVQAEWSTLP